MRGKPVLSDNKRQRDSRGGGGGGRGGAEESCHTAKNKANENLTHKLKSGQCGSRRDMTSCLCVFRSTALSSASIIHGLANKKEARVPGLPPPARGWVAARTGCWLAGRLPLHRRFRSCWPMSCPPSRRRPDPSWPPYAGRD